MTKKPAYYGFLCIDNQGKAYGRIYHHGQITPRDGSLKISGTDYSTVKAGLTAFLPDGAPIETM